MCYKELCRRCGKYSWGGCSKHLNTVYRNIEEGQHCMCRSWPGVAIPSQQTEQPKQTKSSIPPQGNGNPEILDAVANGGLK